jgi:hypothetical protein
MGEEIFGEGGEGEAGAVEEIGVETGLGGAFEIGAFFIADVEGGVRGDACLGEGVVEDAGVGFAGAGLAGEGDGAEKGGDLEAFEDGDEAEVEVREDVEGGDLGELFESGGDVWEELPGVGFGEVLVEVVKEGGDDFWWQRGACGGLEGGRDDGKPPGAVVIGRDKAFGVEGLGGGFPGAAEGGFERGGVERQAVGCGDAGIRMSDGLGELEKGACRVEEQAVKNHLVLGMP